MKPEEHGSGRDGDFGLTGQIKKEGFARAPHTVTGLISGGLLGGFLFGPLGALVGGFALGTAGYFMDTEKSWNALKKNQWEEH